MNSQQAVAKITCQECKRSFANYKNLQTHIQNIHSDVYDYRCSDCSFITKYPFSLKRHLERLHNPDHQPKRPRLSENDREVESAVSLLLNDVVGKAAKRVEASTAKSSQTSALGGRLRVVKIEDGGADPAIVLQAAVDRIELEVEQELASKTGIKLQLMLAVGFYKAVHPEEKAVKYFWSLPSPIYRGSVYEVSELFPKILKGIDDYQRHGSGWIIDYVERLEIYLAKCRPLRGSTYVELPPWLQHKKAIINVQNTDNKCFLWSVLALLHEAPHNPQRVSHYKRFEDTLNMDGIRFPMKTNDIKKFENQNDLSINVYAIDDEQDDIIPYYISDGPVSRRVLHLLIYSDHYVAIRDFNKLLFDQTKNKRKKHYCHRCLINKSSSKLLSEHLELCTQREPTKINMPENTCMKFTNIHKTLRHPLVVYADFECLVSSCDSIPTPKTKKIHSHIPCGYGLITSRNCCGKSDFSETSIYCGKEPVKKFLHEIVDIAESHQATLSNPAPMYTTSSNVDKSMCHICSKHISKEAVKDHCHLCGKIRGYAHNKCNQLYRLSRDITVVFHNLRKYDGHLIMQEIGACAEEYGYEIDVIAKALEDYLSFSLVQKGCSSTGTVGYRIKFIDSVQFLNGSLDALVKNLPKEQFIALKGRFKNQDSQELLQRKGIYPYEYMNSFEKFSEPLPKHDDFFSTLTGENVSNDDYKHAENVWTHFHHNTMEDYHNLYLETDVLLLADVFEAFRTFSLNTYGLDPCHYVTTPSLSFDALLKTTGVELELLSDPDMFLLCEQGIRGGVSQISHRYAEANNPYLTNYDSTKPTSYITYLDKNNLYGWAMLQKLPVNNFEWIENFNEIDWKDIDTEGSNGYLLEVDLEYPENLHDLHDSYPLAPETLEILSGSPYSEQLREKMGLKIPKQKKLVPNLHNKNKYVLHFRNLKLYLQLGLKLSKIHRCLKFNQSAWMAKYIQLNTRLRAEATNALEKDLFKLFNNAVFGKTMENVRKYKNVKLVTNAESFEKLVANPRYRGCMIFNENLVAVSMLRPSTCLNKPISCGQAVLDLSKELMYKFHYQYILQKYSVKNQVFLLFTDTDSLCYWICTPDIYKDMQEDSDEFDFSEYPTNHFLHSTTNKKVPGKMKDETAGVPIEKFCGLRPKMYAMLPEKKRAKGIKKRVVEKDICFQDYVTTLFDETSMSHEMTVIRSHKHHVYTETQTKKSLSAFDDKRWLLNAIESRARGHYLNSV